MPYLSASAVVIHYEEALYQVYAPLPLPNLVALVIGVDRGSKNLGTRATPHEMGEGALLIP